VKIPETVKIGGHVYKVIRNYKFKERTDRRGQIDYGLKEIRLQEEDISGKYVRSEVEQTFIHELLHAVENIYNSQNLNEEIIERLSQGLYQVLKDNKMLR